MGWFSRRSRAAPANEPSPPSAPLRAVPAGVEARGLSSPGGEPWTGRPLQLPALPSPATAAELARRAADAAREVSGIELDYSPASLQHVDTILDGFREPGSDLMAESIFVFGCYIGEVMVRNTDYEWVDTPDDLARHLGALTVYHPGTGTHANPISKAFKRVDYGEPDKLTYFYQVFTAENPHSD